MSYLNNLQWQQVCEEVQPLKQLPQQELAALQNEYHRYQDTDDLAKPLFTFFLYSSFGKAFFLA